MQRATVDWQVNTERKRWTDCWRRPGGCESDAVTLEAAVYVPAAGNVDDAADTQPLVSVRIMHIDHYSHGMHAYSSSTPVQAHD